MAKSKQGNKVPSKAAGASGNASGMDESQAAGASGNASGADQPNIDAQTTTATTAAKGKKANSLIITSKREGFWRCARQWGLNETTVPMDEFTAEQIELLKNEPMLNVVEAFVAA